MTSKKILVHINIYTLESKLESKLMRKFSTKKKEGGINFLFSSSLLKIPKGNI